MAKIKNPLVFSKCFGLAPSALKTTGVFNPVLNIDTKLFIDPLLLHKSTAPEFKFAAKTYKRHFERILGFLKASEKIGDTNWKLARDLFDFKEISGTCLGYGAGSISGSKLSKLVIDEIITTAHAIIKQGVNDPDIFLIAFMLQEKVGPDNLSDMVTNIVIKEISAYTDRFAKKFNIPTANFKMGAPPVDYSLPINPTTKLQNQQIFLLPRDVLRKLPIALSRSEVSDAAAESAEIIKKANLQIGGFLKAKTQAEKRKLKDAILQDKKTLQAILTEFKNSSDKSYDFTRDSDGFMIWREDIYQIADKFPMKNSKLSITNSAQGIQEVVKKIISYFQNLIENNGAWKLLYTNDKSRNEKCVQLLFFMVADAFCKANNIDISPETDSGGGPVDFKFSTGYSGRVLVEMKMATNSSVVAGYTKQLETYKKASKPIASHYVVVETTKSVTTSQKKQLNDFKEDLKKMYQVDSEIFIIDGSKQVSASKKR